MSKPIQSTTPELIGLIYLDGIQTLNIELIGLRVLNTALDFRLEAALRYLEAYTELYGDMYQPLLERFVMSAKLHQLEARYGFDISIGFLLNTSVTNTVIGAGRIFRETKCVMYYNNPGDASFTTLKLP